MTIPRTIPCPDCNGDGSVLSAGGTRDSRWDGPVVCLHCHGNGRLPLERATLGELAHMFERDLPRGWEIRLGIDREGGCVTLHDPAGVEVEYPSDLGTVEAMLVDALQHAIAKAKDEGSKS